MVENSLNISTNSVTTTDMTNTVNDFEVDLMNTDGASGDGETRYSNPYWSEYLGYYKTIPELKKAIDIYCLWCLGKGFTCDPRVEVITDHIIGWGEDHFLQVLWNLLVVKKINGDAYAEIIRDEKTNLILNIKPLDPSSITTIVDKKGIITRYEQTSKTDKKTIKVFKPNEILHLCNDRIADEVHGVSVIQCCKWVIDARNEAMLDYRKVLHRNLIPVRIIEYDSDDLTKRDLLKAQYQDAISKGEVLVVPKGVVEIKNETIAIQDPIAWIRYLENFFYQAVGVPQVILGGSSEFTESGSKISYLTFEQLYAKEQLELEKDLWNQLQLEIKFNKPASLKNEMLSDESKDGMSAGLNMQPNDLIAGRGE